MLVMFGGGRRRTGRNRKIKLEIGGKEIFGLSIKTFD